MLSPKRTNHHDKETEDDEVPFYKEWSVRGSLIRQVLKEVREENPWWKEEWEQGSGGNTWGVHVTKVAGAE